MEKQFSRVKKSNNPRRRNESLSKMKAVVYEKRKRKWYKETGI